MKYYHCSKCGHDSTSRSGMLEHAFHEIIEEVTTENPLP